MRKIIRFAALMMGMLWILGVGSLTSILAQESVAGQEIPNRKEYSIEIRTASESVVFPNHVTIQGTDVSGMTVEEVTAFVENYVASQKQRAITLTVFGNVYNYNGEAFGLTWTNPDVVTEAAAHCSSGNFIDQYKNQKDMDQAPASYEITLAVDESFIRSQVEALANNFTVQPLNATVTRGDNGFEITEAVVGKSFDTEAILAELLSQVYDFSNTEELVYDFPSTDIAPTYTSADFQFSAVPLGSYTTNNLGSDNRRNNLILSAQNMNGTVIYPGETISALALYGEVTEANGYVNAPTYNEGMQVDGIGGGICQTTTTLYNAILRAELTISYRSQHSMLVTYVPPSMDAMVDYASHSDFLSVNSTGYPIYIESYVNGDDLVVNIWGVETRPANRTIDFTTVVETLEWPETLYNVQVNDSYCNVGLTMDNKLYALVEVHPHVVSTSYKIVYEDGVEVSRTVLNHDSYRAMTGTLYRASDVQVANWVVTGVSNAITYPYLNVDIHHEMTFLDGYGWNPYDESIVAEHYY